MAFKQNSPLLLSCLSAARTMLYPSYLTFNWLFCLYYTTFEEDRYPDKVLLRKILLTPVHAALFILCLPLLIVFLPIRCFLVYIRRPFLYSEMHTPYTDRQAEVISEMITDGDYKFGVCSANLCLMPELVSKMNHITNVDYRAKKIGEKIVVSQLFNDEWTKRESKWKITAGKNGCVVDKKSTKEGNRDSFTVENRRTQVKGVVTTSFPYLDVLAIQEAWSTYHNKALIGELHKVFPYIVHDVGTHAFHINRFFLNSGLLVASRHPIVMVDFKPFTHFVIHGKLLAKGLLMMKVNVGKAKDGKQNVGYIFNTHYQSYQGKEKVILKQLDEVYSWSKQFMQDNERAGENILFSVLCGDFNFDNLSPADSENTRHELFDAFEDVCRQTAGCDKPWTVGTELRQDHMFDSLVTTPEGLKEVLEDPALRQCHLVDGDIVEQTKDALVSGNIKVDKHGNVQLFPEGGRRRIDYVTYHKSYPVNVTGVHFVTQLASLTDHVPVALEFTCPSVD